MAGEHGGSLGRISWARSESGVRQFCPYFLGNSLSVLQSHLDVGGEVENVVAEWTFIISSIKRGRMAQTADS